MADWGYGYPSGLGVALAMVCDEARLQLATRPIARVCMIGNVDASPAILISGSIAKLNSRRMSDALCYAQRMRGMSLSSKRRVRLLVISH